MRNFDRNSFCPDKFIAEASERILRDAANRKVFLLVSGGVDSTVVFALLNKALGADRVLGLHVDTGLMRLNESAAILEYMRANGFDNLYVEDAGDDFLNALDGVCEPEKKRRIIGDMYLDVKEKVSNRLALNSEEWILAQGTIYPDILETAANKETGGSAAKIKTHHNRVDAIMELIEKGLIIEPIAPLYKDEVRRVGERLGLPRELLWRHPFPGPGLGVRVLCSDGTPLEDIPAQEKDTLQKIVSEYGYDFCVLPIRSTGKRGGERTYARPVLISGAYDSEKIDKLAAEITASIPSINRVVYDVGAATCRPQSAGGVSVNAARLSSYKLTKSHITRARLDKLREIDAIITNALYESGEYDAIWQVPVVLLPLVDENTNGEAVVLRPIHSTDAMDARAVYLKPETLAIVQNKKTPVTGIGDIFLDITPKPPATIEWE